MEQGKDTPISRNKTPQKPQMEAPDSGKFFDQQSPARQAKVAAEYKKLTGREGSLSDLHNFEPNVKRDIVPPPPLPQDDSRESRAARLYSSMFQGRRGSPEELKEFVNNMMVSESQYNRVVKAEKEEERQRATRARILGQEADRIPRDKKPGVSPEVQAEVDRLQAVMRSMVGIPGYPIPDVTPEQAKDSLSTKRIWDKIKKEEDQVDEARRKGREEFEKSDFYRANVDGDQAAWARLREQERRHYAKGDNTPFHPDPRSRAHQESLNAAHDRAAELRRRDGIK